MSCKEDCSFRLAYYKDFLQRDFHVDFWTFREKNIRVLDHTIMPAYTVNELRRPMLLSQNY